MASLSELQTRLTEAESALHALNTGQAVAETQIDNIRTRYAIAPGPGGLVDYIANLKGQIGALLIDSTAATPSRRAPIGVIW